MIDITYPRLSFRVWAADDSPVTSLTVADITSIAYSRLVSGRWSDTAVTPISDATNADAWAAGRLVKDHADGFGNRYWIDVPQAAAASGAVAVRAVVDLAAAYDTSIVDAEIHELSTADVESIVDSVVESILPSSATFAGYQQSVQDAIRIIQKDDYLASIGRAFEWLITDPAIDFTDDVTVVVGAAGGGTDPAVAPILVGTASLQDREPGSAVLRVEFTSAQTTVNPGRYQFDAHILVSGKRRTEIQLEVVVEPKYAD